jgi:hypothetical protein
MLKGFELQTHGLTEYELKEVIPILARGFSLRIGKGKAITSFAVSKILTDKYGLKIINESRIRKMIHFIRDTGLVPKLIATSKGYWVATSKKELEDWRDSLSGRIKAIEDILIYAELQIKEWENPTKQQQQQL